MAQAINLSEGDKKLLRMLADPKEFIPRCLYIVDQSGQRVPYLLNDVQADYLKNRTRRDIIVKARKMGFSALITAVWLHACAFEQNTRAVVISHEEEATKRLLRRVHDYRESSLFPIQIKGTGSAYELHFPQTNSYFYIGTAGSKAFGRGDDITHLHFCLSGDALVLTADGMVKKIRDFVGGESVRTHTGKIAKVESLSKTKKPGMVEVVSWCNTAFPLKCTSDHKVYACKLGFQQRKKHGEWVSAGDLIPGVHYIGVPRRDYKAKKRHLEMTLLGTERGITPNTDTLEMDYGLGYSMGLYLAEGNINRDSDGRPCAITFSLDRDEGEYVDELDKRFDGLAKISRKYRKTSRTMTATIYNSSLARLFLKELGEKDSKRIPDLYFRCHRDFLDGLVKGYLDGDGHYVPGKNDIFITSIRPQLLTQLRDLMMSLYFGWSSLTRRDAGYWYGRNCKEAFTLVISGRTGYRLREHFGLPHFKDKKSPGAHWKYDRRYVWVPVRTVNKISDEPNVYDLVLSHPDHSYVTISGTVHNSEPPHYQSWDVVTAATEAVVKSGGWVVMESTAKGAGTPFHKLWLRAVRGECEWRPHFYGWFHDRLNRKPGAAPFELIEEEKKLKESFNLDLDQLAWRRWKLNEMQDPALFPQEHPATWEEAFLASGRMLFDWQAIKRHEDSAQPPKWVGHLMDIGSALHIEPDPKGPLSVWRTPEQGQRYLVVADSADGVPGGAYSVADVYNMRTWEQVAQYRGHPDPRDFGTVLSRLGAYYGWGLVAVENNTPGQAVLVQLTNLGYPNIYDEPNESGDRLGWQTTEKSKGEFINDGRACLKDGSLKLNSPATISELRTFVLDERGKMGPQESCWQDCVIVVSKASNILMRHHIAEPEQRRGSFREVMSKFRGDFGISGGDYREAVV